MLKFVRTLSNVMGKKRILFVINTISGTGKKKSVVSSIDRFIDKSACDCEVKFTEYAGHAAVMAEEAAAAGTDIVVAVGGDGTVNEVARSIVHTGTALGIVPCGSGNGLARHLQIPLDAARAVKIINEGVVHCLDYGRINEMPFFCTCGVGFDAFVSLKFAGCGKRGPLAYVENTLREGLKYKPATYVVEDESGTFRHEAFLIACANASQYGNNAYIAPNASMKDGLMDVMILEPFSAIEAPQIAVQLFNKTLPQNSHMKTFRSRKVRIRRDAPGAVHCDGDPFMTGTEINVELIPRSFNVVVNPDARSRDESVLQVLSGYFNEWKTLPAELLKKGGEDIRRVNKAVREQLRKLNE